MVSNEGNGFGARLLIQYARNYAQWFANIDVKFDNIKNSIYIGNKKIILFMSLSNFNIYNIHYICPLN